MMQVEQPMEEPAVELDEDDTADLLDDCRALLEDLIERPQPKYIANQMRVLLKRLDEAAGYYTLQ